MTELTITLTDMAHGGLALGRDREGRPVFVPFAIPGETVRVRLPRPGDRAAQATRAALLAVVKPSPDRVAPRCRHFGICGNCHFQHMTYAAQLRAKEAVVRDQLTRVAGLKNPPLRPILPYPQEYNYRAETTLFRAEEGGLGYWSPVERRIFRVEECPILQPQLQEALADLDVDLPDLRKLTLRLGDDDELLAALEVEDVEPPELAADFPISVAIVLPDRTAASLIGDPYLVRTVRGRPFRVSPGVPFPHSPAAAELLIDAILELAGLNDQLLTSDTEPAPFSFQKSANSAKSADDSSSGLTILEAPGGAGWLTAALAERAAAVWVIEPNPDAVADAAENLDAFDNVSIYEGTAEDVLPALEAAPDVAVFQAETGLPAAVWPWLERARPGRLVVAAEVGVLAKEAKRLAKAGYRAAAFQPVDVAPQ
uniref:class I SAM-dependent RNA methyltransferase n=1 Tax=Promineifilum sp. TaxID=2664178 RepID=UPI0035ADE471